MILDSVLSPLQFALVLTGVLLLGAILFFLTGFIHVKKGYVAIIERTGTFLNIYKSGFHYFFPLLYRRVGMYPVGEAKIIYTLDREDYRLTIEILDVKKYHYEGHHDAEGIVKASLKDSKDKLSETLVSRFKKVGVRFIQLEKIKKGN